MAPKLLVLHGLVLLPGFCSAGAWRGHLETEDLPAYLRDRGVGVPLSMFGTYIQDGQLIVYPFFEYYRDADFEYKPAELGFGEDRDYRGGYEASEELLFIAYGVADRLAIEAEGAIIQAELEKSRLDFSGVPDELEESGLGDVEGQLRWRWARESAGSPEIFSYFETVFPTQDEGSLIGTTDWELKLGFGVIRGFSFGTLTARAAVEYDAAESKGDIGEVALEFLRRLSDSWRLFGGFEGTQDEVEAIAEAQWHFGRGMFLKLNHAFGVTSKATDWAPEAGVVLSF
jgi:hypothetical protein